MSLALALAVQLLPAPDSVRWEYLAGDREESIELSPASINRDGATVRFVVRVTARATRPGTGLRMMIMGMVLDCARDRIGIERLDGYGETGLLLGSRETPAARIEFQPLTSYGPPEPVRRRVCVEAGG